MTAALPMGGQKITGMADPTAATDAASKNYVDTTTGAFFSTGDVKATFKTVADTGWLMMNDTTFGSATSGAFNTASVNQALFLLLFTNIADADAPILTSGGGATTRAAQGSASAAWAANCRMTLPKALGRAFASAGAGSGLSARPLGSAAGQETHLLTLGELPTGITSVGTATSISVSPPGGNSVPYAGSGSVVNNPGAPTSGGGNSPFTSAGSGALWNFASSLTGSGSASVTSNNTGGSPHSIYQPTTFVNWMVKL